MKFRLARNRRSARLALLGALAVCVATTAQAAEEPWYCSGRMSNEAGEQSPFFGFEYAMLPYAVKSLCKLDNQSEAAAIRQVYRGLGCTADSGIGQDVEAQLAITDRVMILEGMLGTSEEPDFSHPMMQELCTVATDIALLPFQWGTDADEANLTADQQAALEAQLPLWKQLFDLFQQMPQP